MLTLFSAPEGLSPPKVVSLTSTSVHITWEEPTTPNGILTKYTIEKWVDNFTAIVLQTVAPDSPKSYYDEGAQLQPYTDYLYRISATTGKSFFNCLKLSSFFFCVP